jgi:hypothetical protein
LKYIVLIFIVYFFYSYIKKQRMKEQTDAFNNDTLKAPQLMTECAACAVHFPANEAYIGKNGHYCCRAHLNASESRS